MKSDLFYASNDDGCKRYVNLCHLHTLLCFSLALRCARNPESFWFKTADMIFGHARNNSYPTKSQ
jgi:hypothetical protein